VKVETKKVEPAKPEPTKNNDVTGDFDEIYKLLIIGEIGVGKSSLLVRFTDSTYNESNLSTIACDF